jgi:membrane associated rhomboid family serine protease
MPAFPPGKRPLPAWLRPLGERLTPTIRNLVIVETALFALVVMVPPLRAPVAEHLTLGPLLLSGELWQPLTSLFVHLNPLGFIMNMIGLWFLGAAIERVLGRRRFFLLFFATGIAENLVLAGLMAAFGISLSNEGCGDSVLALFVALGVAYGRAPIQVWGQLVLQARILAWVFLGWAVLSLLLQLAWPYLIATLVAQSVAYLLAGGKTGAVGEFLAGLRGKPRGKFDVLDGGRGKGSKKYVN